MKKGNFKQFLKKNWGWFVFIIWIFLITVTLTYSVEGSSISIKIILGAVSIIYTLIGCIMIDRASAKWEKQEAESKEKRLRELETRYKDYVELVNAQVQETLKDLKKALSLDIIEVNEKPKYLISFDDYKKRICKNRIKGKPDSFILATCLIYSIIDNPIIIIKTDGEIAGIKNIKLSINIDIAMKCAFQIISEPSTYYEDLIWIEEKHPKVNIAVPDGLIKKQELYKRIINTIYNDELEDKRASIMQFSNLLHLIYLNCQ